MTDTEQYRAEQLKIINNYRAKHGAGPLVMDQNMNNYAQEWANNLASRNSMYHRSNNKYGENIFMGGAPLHHNASKYWYDEISQYNFNNPEYNYNNFMAIGHFSALVWKSSQKIGIGVKKSGSGQYYVVANFDPAGNFGGRFGANVLPPGTKPPKTATSVKEEPAKAKDKDVVIPASGKFVFHVGIGCDGCEDYPIVGVRYNCTVCDEYDLCEKCHKKGVHKEHKMQEITKPQNAVEKVDELIKKFDVDGNGVIEYPEYWLMAKKLWKIEDEKQIREGFESIDKSGDGKISVDEFKEFYMGKDNDDISGTIEKLIKEFDVDGNGVIEYPEFWLMAKKLWKDMDEKTIKGDFKTIDQSGDGKLSAEELRAYLKEHTSTKKPEEAKVDEDDGQEEEEEVDEEDEPENTGLPQQQQMVSNPGATTWFNTCGGGGGNTFYYTRQGG